jgi:hypothetical protein
MKKQTSEVISGEGLVNDVHRVLNLGLDVHYRQVTVALQEDGGTDQICWKNGSPGISELGPQEAGRRLGNLQPLRSRSQRLLVTPGASEAGGQKLGGGAQGDGSRRQEAKD